MKKTAGLLASLVLCLGLLASCSTLFPSGIILEKTYDLKDFTTVDASSAFSCTITQGKNWSVVATVDQNVVDYVDISVSNSILTVGLKPHWSVAGLATMKVAITMPSLATLKLSGASSGVVTGFNDASDSLNLGLSGASSLKWTGGAPKSTTLDASGASTIEMDSFATTAMSATVSGASKLTGKAGSATATTMSLNVSGASTVIFDVSSKITGEVSGASTLRYGLSPDVSSINSSGSSTVSAR